MNICIINGPNLNRLEQRDPMHYGGQSLQQIEVQTRQRFSEHKLEWYQSNHEGQLIDKIQSLTSGVQGLVYNLGGYSHTSVALADALELLSIPKVEVHLSQLYRRGPERQQLLTAKSADVVICGAGAFAYGLGIEYIVQNAILTC